MKKFKILLVSFALMVSSSFVFAAEKTKNENSIQFYKTEEKKEEKENVKNFLTNLKEKFKKNLYSSEKFNIFSKEEKAKIYNKFLKSLFKDNYVFYKLLNAKPFKCLDIFKLIITPLNSAEEFEITISAYKENGILKCDIFNCSKVEKTLENLQGITKEKEQIKNDLTERIFKNKIMEKAPNISELDLEKITQQLFEKINSEKILNEIATKKINFSANILQYETTDKNAEDSYEISVFVKKTRLNKNYNSKFKYRFCINCNKIFNNEKERKKVIEDVKEKFFKSFKEVSKDFNNNEIANIEEKFNVYLKSKENLNEIINLPLNESLNVFREEIKNEKNGNEYILKISVKKSFCNSHNCYILNHEYVPYISIEKKIYNFENEELKEKNEKILKFLEKFKKDVNYLKNLNEEFKEKINSNKEFDIFSKKEKEEICNNVLNELAKIKTLNKIVNAKNDEYIKILNLFKKPEGCEKEFEISIILNKENDQFNIESLNCYPISKNYKKIYDMYKFKKSLKFKREEEAKALTFLEKLENYFKEYDFEEKFKQKLNSNKEFNRFNENEKNYIYKKILENLNLENNAKIKNSFFKKLIHAKAFETIKLFEFEIGNIKDFNTIKFKVVVQKDYKLNYNKPQIFIETFFNEEKLSETQLNSNQKRILSFFTKEKFLKNLHKLETNTSLEDEIKMLKIFSENIKNLNFLNKIENSEYNEKIEIFNYSTTLKKDNGFNNVIVCSAVKKPMENGKDKYEIIINKN